MWGKRHNDLYIYSLSCMHVVMVYKLLPTGTTNCWHRPHVGVPAHINGVLEGGSFFKHDSAQVRHRCTRIIAQVLLLYSAT